MDKYLEANAIISKFCQSYNELKKDLPIRPSEMGLLNIVVMREGKFTPLMLSELLEVSKPMITSHISVLEKKGYITKEYSLEDKRSFYVLPTERAVELVKRTTEQMNNSLVNLETLIGKDKFETLRDLMIEANENLKTIKGEK